VFGFVAAPSSAVYVSDGVSYRTERSQRVICVHGVVFAHYAVTDRAAEAYALITLCESGYATQVQVARSFGFSTRSVRRYQQRFEGGGMGALARAAGRRVGARIGSRKERGRDQAVVHLKAKGLSNRAIAGQLGVSEKAIRKRLRRLGWHSIGSTAQPRLALEPPTTANVRAAVAVSDSANGVAGSALVAAAERAALRGEEDAVEAQRTSRDRDPLNRSTDRLLAKLGLIEDAAPVFAAAVNLPMAGALLAMPSLLASGLLPIAHRLYGSIGPAFYGLRTTLVAYLLLALLRIPRPEALKEHAPAPLGRIVGLDRMLEVKTLRRKLTELAARRVSSELGRELARRRVAERGHMLGFLYVDGHVRAYHGKHTIAKGYLTRTRLAVPATSDYWVNDSTGDPLFVITAAANAAMTRMLEPILAEARTLLGAGRRATVVFDRGGWSPKLFVKLLAMEFDLLTYRKGRVPRVAEKRFAVRQAKLDGRAVEYRLFDQPVRFLKGKLRLRQVTRLTESGHQTPVLTSRWDLPDIEVAYRMFERWRQENFFKYMRQEYLLDALSDYQVEADDPLRSVPNPVRQAVDRQLRKARAGVDKIKETYGALMLEQLQGGRLTVRMLNAAQKSIHRELDAANEQVETLRVQQKSHPVRIPLAQARPNEELVKLSTERKHLTNVLKLVAYQIESDLVNLLRPHYARIDDEGRTLIQTALQGAASLEPTDTELRITLCPFSSAHRSHAVAALCETLNQSTTYFPGTRLRMHFGVAGV
jgi:hypothetical protein